MWNSYSNVVASCKNSVGHRTFFPLAVSLPVRKLAVQVELQPDQTWLCCCSASWLLVLQGGALQKTMLRRCWHQYLSGVIHLLQALVHYCEYKGI